MAYTLLINGQSRNADVEADTPLLWVLRETLGLTGTKYGCGTRDCGACTVLLDGRAVLSCHLTVSEVQRHAVTTIEGLSAAGTHAVQRAWIEEDVPQCGYCQPGMVLGAVALLERKPRPSDADIDSAIANLCRCGTYDRVRRAIHRAAALRTGGSS